MLQRSAGNQAVTRMILQRQSVEPRQYIEGVIRDNAGTADWDPKWTDALRASGAGIDFKTHLPAVDDASASDLLKLIKVVETAAQLYNAKPNIHRLAIDALRWVAGIETTSGATGFGSLDTSAAGFTGRPAFPQVTAENIPLRSRQHRRHIVAWHDIRAFVEQAYAARKDVVVRAIREAMGDPDPAAKYAVAEAVSTMSSANWTDADFVKAGLFVMNGNPRNLWAGRGPTNSALNTSQMHMSRQLGEATTFTALRVLAEKWEKLDKAKPVHKHATQLGSQVLAHHGGEAQKRWEQAGRDATKEYDYVRPVVDTVNDWVLSNLQKDALAESPEENEKVQEKLQDLSGTGDLIDNVVQGKAMALDELPVQVISDAIKDLMAYMGR